MLHGTAKINVKKPTLDERITWHVVYAKTVRVGHLSGVLGEIKMRKLL
jgi:hypothetical protein